MLNGFSWSTVLAAYISDWAGANPQPGTRGEVENENYSTVLLYFATTRSQFDNLRWFPLIEISRMEPKNRVRYA